MKKINLKKICAAGMAAMMLFGAGGCSGNSDAEKPQDNTSGNMENTEQNDGTTLVFWNVAYKTVDDTGMISTEDLVFNKTVEAFEKEHGVKVEVVNQTYDNIYQLFKTAGLAKNGPDISYMWTGGYTNDYRDYIEPLDNYFTEEELTKFPNLDLCRTDFSADGELLGIPTDITTLNLYYNKEAFKKAGIDENIQFKTFDELEQACEKLKAAGITPFAMIDGNGYATAWAAGEALSHTLGSEDIFKLRTGEIKMNDDIVIDALKPWFEFAQKANENGWTNPDAFTTATEDVYVDFYTGNTAMRLGGSWDAQVLYDEMGDNVGTMKIPRFHEDDMYGDYITAQFSNNLVVTNYSKNKELAVELVKALSTPEFYLGRYEQDQQLPARLDVDLESAAVENPLSIQSYSWIQEDKNVVGFDAVISADAAAEFYRLSPMIITGKTALEEAMETVQSKNTSASE